MIGPEDFHDALFELSTLLLGEEDTNSILQRIVDLTCAAIPGCCNCGVSLLTADRVTTAAATDGTTLQLDGAQYSNGEGPCLHAARTATMVRVDDFSHDDRFRGSLRRRYGSGTDGIKQCALRRGWAFKKRRPLHVVRSSS